MAPDRADGAHKLDAYKKGALVWIRHPELVWIGAELCEDLRENSNSLELILGDGCTVSLSLKDGQLPPLRNPEILVGKDDLTSLSYLHEPAVLFNLRYRFLEQQCIYTYCGIVLVAINPYKDCSHLYGNEMIQVYRGIGRQVRDLDPHMYAVAEEAFYDMAEFGKCQSIIVSGESGAGKTVSAKFAMRYFAAVGQGMRGAESGVEQRVLASNPIMEAIGNAKTIRNDNSSRFGKYIQLNFTERFSISGAQMKTYLLEKSRLVFQASRERNYHIFYQICAARNSSGLLNGLQLDDPTKFHYTNQGGKNWWILGVDDEIEFGETVAALELLGFGENEQRNIFRLLSGLLHLGNVKFAAETREVGFISKSSSQTVELLCDALLDIDAKDLIVWLCQKEIRAANEVVRKPLDLEQATASRDALAKKLYANLFNWIVAKINKSLANMDRPTPSPRKMQKSAKQIVSDGKTRFIGVLDIYGFETFELNSFEQFCINYANEKLQQQFNKHVFKLEQEEYVREGIEWVRIDFYDNQPCIDLIEGKLGIIDLLDEQCRIGRGTDNDYLSHLQASATLKSHKNFRFPKIREPAFIVAHFAADVTYQVAGFLDKNRDNVSEQLINVMKQSEFQFLRELVTEVDENQNLTNANRKLSKGYSVSSFGKSDSSAPQKQTKKTVASQFRSSLHELMSILEVTRPHYVRCIKPNDYKEAFVFEPTRAIEQLRACGVLETVRLSAAGYPSRWAYDEFSLRYRVLLPEAKDLWRRKPKDFAQRTCRKWITDESKFALGHNKIFFRTGEVATLERLRSEILTKSATEIQRIWRGYKGRQYYLRVKRSIRTIQAVGRAYIVWRRLLYLNMHRAVVILQKHVRGWRDKRRFESIRTTALLIQTHWRAKVVRDRVRKLRFERTIVSIQRYCRGYLVRREFRDYRKKLVIVQCCVRKWLAKRKLRRLKIEARSVGRLQKLNKGFENKIIELQQKIDVLTTENRWLQSQADCVESLQCRVSELTTVQSAHEETKAELKVLELSVEALKTECNDKERERCDLEAQMIEMQVHLELQLSNKCEQIESLESAHTEACEAVSNLKEELTDLKEKLEYESEKALMATQEKERLERQLSEDRDIAPLGESLGMDALSDLDPSPSRASTVRVQTPTESSSEDIRITIQQQRLIAQLRDDKESLERKVDRLEATLQSSQLISEMQNEGTIKSYEEQRKQEYEVLNLKLRNELNTLLTERSRKGADGMNMHRLLDSCLQENERRTEESIELRALLAAQYEKHSLSRRSSSAAVSSINSDDDVVDALEEQLCKERQCRALKGMIEELSRQLEDRERTIASLQIKCAELEVSSPSPVDLLWVEHSSSSEQMQCLMQNEMNRLVTENMLLQHKLDNQSDLLREGRLPYAFPINSDSANTSLDKSFQNGDVIHLEERQTNRQVEHSALLQIRDFSEFIRTLVTDLKPRVARRLSSCLPSYLLLLAFRYLDHAKDENALSALFGAFHAHVKDITHRSQDLDILSVWLVNCWNLLNLLRQYSNSENEEWGARNTPSQKSHCIQHFDLAPLREKLIARVEGAYEQLMKAIVEPILSPKIVPAVLKHESANEILAMLAPNGLRKSSSERRLSERALEDLLELLTHVHRALSDVGAESVLLSQVFGQICSWICALALNHLMFNKELCNFTRAIQIKHNVTEIQNWLTSKKLGHLGDRLEPLVQASHLLQSKKDDSNLDTLCGEMTAKLKPKQIVTLLQHYTPSDGFEESKLPSEFIQRVMERLQEKWINNTDLDQNPIMMGKFLVPFDCATFVYSDVCLEKLQLPGCLRLEQIARLL